MRLKPIVTNLLNILRYIHKLNTNYALNDNRLLLLLFTHSTLFKQPSISKKNEECSFEASIRPEEWKNVSII